MVRHFDSRVAALFLAKLYFEKWNRVAIKKGLNYGKCFVVVFGSDD